MGESINVSFTFTCATRPLVFLLRNYKWIITLLSTRRKRQVNLKSKREINFKKEKKRGIIINFRWIFFDIWRRRKD